MSMLSAQVRSRLPRLHAATIRDRLRLVEPASVQAPRTPFVVLVAGLLVAGVVGLLLFNTQMQQASFHATALEQQATALTAEQQSLDMALQRLRDPQDLALRARRMGMVVPANPAFLRLSDGRVLGDPTVTTTADGIRVHGYAADKPSALRPAPRVVRVVAPARSARRTGTATAGRPAADTTRTPSATGTAHSSTDTGAASPKSTVGQGRKKTR